MYLQRFKYFEIDSQSARIKKYRYLDSSAAQHLIHSTPTTNVIQRCNVCRPPGRGTSSPLTTAATTALTMLRHAALLLEDWASVSSLLPSFLIGISSLLPHRHLIVNYLKRSTPSGVHQLILEDYLRHPPSVTTAFVMFVIIVASRLVSASRTTTPPTRQHYCPR